MFVVLSVSTSDGYDEWEGCHVDQLEGVAVDGVFSTEADLRAHLATRPLSSLAAARVYAQCADGEAWEEVANCPPLRERLEEARATKRADRRALAEDAVKRAAAAAWGTDDVIVDPPERFDDRYAVASVVELIDGLLVGGKKSSDDKWESWSRERLEALERDAIRALLKPEYADLVAAALWQQWKNSAGLREYQRLAAAAFE